jgi:hypothetical protein
MYPFPMTIKNSKRQLNICSTLHTSYPVRPLHHPTLREIWIRITRWRRSTLFPNHSGLLTYLPMETAQTCQVNSVSNPLRQREIFNEVLTLEFHFMNPVVISGAYIDLNLLRHMTWIDVSSIDLWLLDMWRTLSQPRFRYLAMFFIPPIGQAEVTREEIDHFRSFFPLLPPTPAACPYENVLYVLNTGEHGKSGNHFCVIAFIPSSKLIYIIRRKYNANHVNYDNQDWISWDGQCIWTRVCSLFGWNSCPMRLCSVNWV